MHTNPLAKKNRKAPSPILLNHTVILLLEGLFGSVLFFDSTFSSSLHFFYSFNLKCCLTIGTKSTSVCWVLAMDSDSAWTLAVVFSDKPFV